MALVTFGACVLNSETVSGPMGERGPDGAPGVPGTPGAPGATTATLDGGAVSLQNVVDLVAAQQKAIAELEAQVKALQNGNPDCPSDYTPVDISVPTSLKVCVKGLDEVVKVGTGGSAFWIDRYEASVWTTFDGMQGGVQKFAPNDDTDATQFPKNGQILVKRYALSVKDKIPAVNITWFQALETCAASGKRLPTLQEWQRAVRGTFDPGANDGNTNKRCNTMTLPDKATRLTGRALAANAATSCVSDWGAEDMIGNVWEWTADWQAGLSADAGAAPSTTWPDLPGGDFHKDGVNGISGSVYVASDLAPVSDLPAAAIRGGGVWSGVGAGAFALDLRLSPTSSDWDQGFRCALGR
jgi:formylglycine-generating enzyme required for sulfatase activity